MKLILSLVILVSISISATELAQNRVQVAEPIKAKFANIIHPVSTSESSCSCPSFQYSNNLDLDERYVSGCQAYCTASQYASCNCKVDAWYNGNLTGAQFNACRCK